MKFLRVLPLVTSALLMSACGNTDYANNNTPEALLYGDWNCKLSAEEEGVKTTLDYNVTYVRNGKSNSFGVLKFQAPDIPELEYSISDSANWELKNGYLVETTTEIKLVNVSHPEFDKFLNLESMFPQNISESAKILVLNDSLLTVKSESSGEISTCNKVTKK